MEGRRAYRGPGFCQSIGAGHEPDLTEEETRGLIAAMEPARLVTQPLKHVGDPRDIGNMAMFLASDRAAHITGQVIPVDGGVTAGETLKQNELFGRTRAEYLRSIGKE